MRRWLRWGGILVAALVVAALIGRFAGGRLLALIAWVEGLGPWGPIAFVGLYVLATVVLIPGSALTLAAGALFGIAEGTLYAFTGATLGASAAFLISRHLARDAVERRLRGDERIRAIDRAIGRQGRRVVFLLRLSPVFPFTLLNYALGLTHVRFADYLLASAGMLPATLLYVYNGKLMGELATLGARGIERGRGYYLLLLLGLAATVAVTVYVTRLARRALREETEDAVVASAG